MQARVLAVWSLLLVAPAPAAQVDKDKKWKLDPYTQNEPEAMKKAGYVSFGPFPYGDKHTTADVENAIGYEKFLWVETAHFKLGCSLTPYTLPPEPEVKKRYLAELTRLSERLPKVNVKAQILDPWLRLHLFAMRIEDVYTKFQDLIGYTDKDFPPDPDKLVIGPKYMGYGPYLGQKGKYLLLLTQKVAPYGEYLKKFIGKNQVAPQRHNFKEERDSLFFGVAAEMPDADFKVDIALHGHVAFNLAINLLDGYKHYSYDLPVWLREGLGHWFERNVSPKYNSYDKDEGSEGDPKTTSNYEAECRKLLLMNKYASFAEASKWRHYGDIKFNDHVCLWSRVSYLIETDKKKFAEFLELIKSRVDPKTWSPDTSNLIEAQRDALTKTYGLSPRTFDEKWKEWALKEYANK